MEPCSRSQRNLTQLEDASGLGRGHYPPHVVAIGLEHPAPLLGHGASRFLVVDGSDGLGGLGERRIGRVDLDHREQRRDRALEGHQVAQLLFHEVPDHALGLGTEDIERVRRHLLVGRALERQQAHLRAVPMSHHQLVLLGHRSQLLRSGPDVRPLVLGRHGLTAAQQRIPTKGDDDSHLSLTSTRDHGGGGTQVVRGPRAGRPAVWASGAGVGISIAASPNVEGTTLARASNGRMRVAVAQSPA